MSFGKGTLQSGIDQTNREEEKQGKEKNTVDEQPSCMDPRKGIKIKETEVIHMTSSKALWVKDDLQRPMMWHYDNDDNEVLCC